MLDSLLKTTNPSASLQSEATQYHYFIAQSAKLIVNNSKNFTSKFQVFLARFPLRHRCSIGNQHRHCGGAMSTPKAEVTSMLQALPDDSSFEDIHYHLYVLEKVKRG